MNGVVEGYGGPFADEVAVLPAEGGRTGFYFVDARGAGKDQRFDGIGIVQGIEKRYLPTHRIAGQDEGVEAQVLRETAYIFDDPLHIGLVQG